MRRVIIESPCAGDIKANLEYAKRCCLDAIAKGEAPFASHLFYTLFLDDTKGSERRTGMECGFSWGQQAEACCVYTDNGISEGMVEGIARAQQAGIPIEYRNFSCGEC